MSEIKEFEKELQEHGPLQEGEESLADLYREYGEEPPHLPGLDASQVPADLDYQYRSAAEEYEELAERQAELQYEADMISQAAEQGVSRGMEAAIDKDAKAAQMRDEVYKYAEPEDRSLIDQAEALEAEFYENEARLAQGQLEGNVDEIQAGESHRARIQADINALPRQVPSVEKGVSERGRHWQENTLKWLDFNESEKEQFLPDLREAIGWSNESDARFLVSMNPETRELYRVACPAESTAKEQISRLKQDERLKGVGAESLAYEAHKRGFLGGIHACRKINPPAKSRAKETEERTPEGDIHIVTPGGETFEESFEEKKPVREGPKPRTHIFSRIAT